MVIQRFEIVCCVGCEEKKIDGHPDDIKILEPDSSVIR